MEPSFHDEALNVSSSLSDHSYDFPPQTTLRSIDDEPFDIPLSPDSRRYKKKMTLLSEKFDELQESNDVLRNRLLQMQKEISQQEKLKRMLVLTLESRGDAYYNAKIEFPSVSDMPVPQTGVDDGVQREKKKRERKERDRVREKARKQAKREAERKAKLEAELARQNNEKKEAPNIPQPGSPKPAMQV